MSAASQLVAARIVPNGQHIREVIDVIGAFEYARASAFIMRRRVGAAFADDRWTVFCGVKVWPAEERTLRDRIRGVVSEAYRAPWSLEYQGAVNRLLIAAGVSGRWRTCETGLLSAAELLEMGAAMQGGTTVEAFAERIIDRAAAEEDRRRRNEWSLDAAGAS